MCRCLKVEELARRRDRGAIVRGHRLRLLWRDARRSGGGGGRHLDVAPLQGGLLSALPGDPLQGGGGAGQLAW